MVVSITSAPYPAPLALLRRLLAELGFCATGLWT
jgi:hypothetical protein